MANFTSNPYFGYSDLLNTFTMSSVDSLSVNDLTVNGIATFPNIPINSFVGTNSNNNLVSRSINGSNNQIIILSGNNGVTLTTPQPIGITSNVQFNSATLQGATITGLTGNTATFNNLFLNNLNQTSFLGSSNKSIIPYGLTGTINQINTNYGVNGCTLSLPQNIHTSAAPRFASLNLNGRITQNISGNKGFVIGDIGSDTPTNYAGICHQSLASSFNNSCLQTNNGGDVIYNAVSNKILVFAQGGIHRFRVWNTQAGSGILGQCEVVSSDDYISSTNSALRVNGGIYCGKKIYSGTGVLTDSIESNSNTLNIGSNSNTSTVNLACSTGVQTVNIGLGGVARTNINIGGVNDIVSIGGTLTYVNSTNLDITNNQIFINSNGTTLTARGAGVIISTSGGTYSGWIREDTTTGTQFLFKPVESPYQLNTPTLIDNSEIVTTKETQTITGNKTFTNVNFTGISGATIRCGDFVATTADIRGLTAGIILAGSIASSSLLGTALYFGSATGTTLYFGSATGTTLNCQGATINILKTNDITSNNIVSNNIYGTTMIFSTGGGTTLSVQSAILGGATSSKLLRVDANKNIVSSLYDDSNFVDTSTNQTIGGNKTFNNSVVVNNLSINGAIATFSTPSKLLALDSTNVVCADVSKTNLADSVVMRDSSSNIYVSGITTTNINVSSLTSSKIVLSDSNKNIVSSSYGISDLSILGVTATHTAKKTFSDLEVTNYYKFPYWASFTVTDGTPNQTIAAALTKVKWNSSAEQAGSSAFTITSNTDINVPSVGVYMVTWNRRVTNAFTGENDVYIGTDLNSNLYGIQQIPASAYYVSCSAIIPITSVPAKIWAGAYSQNANLVLDNNNYIYNRLSIYLLSSSGSII